MASDDEPSDACSRTDGDSATMARWNNKRKIARACSYPNKKRASVLRKGSQVSAICALAAVVLMVVYFFMREFDEDWLFEEEDEQEDDEGDDEEEWEKAGGGDEEEHEEEEDEDEEDDDDARLDLFNVILECFKTTKAWAERELGPENPILEETLGMLRIIPGFEEALMKSRREAVKAERCLEF